MSENAVTQVTGHFDKLKLFPYKSFRCKFINSSCKSFHVLGYSPQMFFFVHSQTILEVRVFHKLFDNFLASSRISSNFFRSEQLFPF